MRAPTTCSIATLAALFACGGEDDAAPPDAIEQPATVMAAMAAGGTWMEGFVWTATAYTTCTGCEHLTTLAVSADHYDFGVFERSPGQPATAMRACSVRFDYAETAVDGVDPRDRTSVALTLGANDCGFAITGVPDTWQFQVVTREPSGAPSLLAYWPGDAASTFPGYAYQSEGTKADPLIPCPTAPGTLCEPSCNLGDVPAGGCGLPEP